jgi:hypothetical protein
VSTKLRNIHKFVAGSLAVAGVAVIGVAATTYADNITQLEQEILPATLSTDVVNASGTPVANPAVVFPDIAQSAAVETSTADYPSGTNRALVSNPAGDSTWSLQLQAYNPPTHNTALWQRDGGGGSFDFNGTAAQGQMTIDATVAGGATLTNVAGTATGISRQVSPEAFAQGTKDIINILTATGAAPWEGYLTGIKIHQTIPAGQASGIYHINLQQTITNS